MTFTAIHVYHIAKTPTAIHTGLILTHDMKTPTAIHTGLMLTHTYTLHNIRPRVLFEFK